MRDLLVSFPGQLPPLRELQLGPDTQPEEGRDVTEADPGDPCAAGQAGDPEVSGNWGCGADSAAPDLHGGVCTANDDQTRHCRPHDMMTLYTEEGTTPCRDCLTYCEADEVGATDNQTRGCHVRLHSGPPVDCATLNGGTNPPCADGDANTDTIPDCADGDANSDTVPDCAADDVHHSCPCVDNSFYYNSGTVVPETQCGGGCGTGAGDVGGPALDHLALLQRALRQRLRA